MFPLDKIFKPRTIAAIGGSDRPGTVGYALMQNLLNSRYEGHIYPVNPGHSEVAGLKSYSSVRKIPDSIDLAVIAAPAAAVPDIVRECGEAGVGGAIIISAGFREAGAAGRKLYAKIAKIARQYQLRIIGPNCLGVIAPQAGLNATFASRGALAGNLAFISQSGALCTAILDWAAQQQVGFSHFVSIGEMADVGFHDLIDYFGADRGTACILIYMESLGEPRRFLSAARAFARNKPIIVLKSGQSEEGAKAALSHTGSIAGNDDAFTAAFQRAGIIRVSTVSELFHLAQAFSMQPRPRGNRLAIVTNAGGPAVLATDYLVKNGGQLARLSPHTLKELNQLLPPAWSHGMPVDILGDSPPWKYEQAIRLVLADENVDGVLAVTASQAVITPKSLAEAAVAASRDSWKTVLACWMGEEDVAEGREVLEQGKIPHYRYPESAVFAFLSMHHHDRNLELLFETPAAYPQAFHPDRDTAGRLIREAQEKGQLLMPLPAARQLLSCYDLPVTAGDLAQTPEEATLIAARVGFPVVLKVQSPDIIHKTEARGVELGLQTEEQVASAFRRIRAAALEYRPDARIEGVWVEKQASRRFELLIGAKKDPLFGPVIAFGMGGTAVEVFRDVSFGLPPLNMALARQMMERTRIWQLLKGHRGQAGVPLEQLQFALVKFAALLADFPEIGEIDINPFAMDAEDAAALDIRILLGKPAAPRPQPWAFDHLVISPYPEQYQLQALLRNGQPVLLRPIRPEDEPLEADMFEKLSRETIYLRFFGHVPRPDHQFLVYFTHLDYDRELAIVAEVEQAGEKMLAGVVRLVNDYGDASAEFAILVADPWQGQGLGTLLMDFMLDIARERGLRKISATALSTNETMMQMFRRRGFRLVSQEGAQYRVELVLEAAG